MKKSLIGYQDYFKTLEMGMTEKKKDYSRQIHQENDEL